MARKGAPEQVRGEGRGPCGAAGDQVTAEGTHAGADEGLSLQRRQAGILCLGCDREIKRPLHSVSRKQHSQRR